MKTPSEKTLIAAVKEPVELARLLRYEWPRKSITRAAFACIDYETIHDDSLRRLLAAGADMAWRNTDEEPSGNTLLHMAAFWENDEAVSILLNAGADPNILNLWHETPLSVMGEDGSPEPVALFNDIFDEGDLLCAAPSVGASFRKALHLLEEAGGIEGDLVEDGAHPDARLLIAAQQGDAPAALAALAEGVDVNARGCKGATALMLAARRGDVAMAQLLLAAGADPLIACSYAEGLTATAFYHAARSGCSEMLRLLLPLLPPGDVRQRELSQALLPAAARGHLDTIRFLTAEGADVNFECIGYDLAGSPFTYSASRYAAINNQRAAYFLLREAGAACTKFY